MIGEKKYHFILKYFPACASGLLLTLSFPKPEIWPLAFFALVPWLIFIKAMTPKESFNSGLIAGLFHFSTLMYWIVPTVHVYGGLHIVLAASTLILLSLYLSIYMGVFAYLSRRFSLSSYFHLLLLSFLWVGLEYIRTYAFTGLPWGLLGYSQYSNLWFIQISDITGVYGVSFLIILVNLTIASLWNKFFFSTHSLLVLGYSSILILGTLFYGYNKINLVDEKILMAPKTSISVIQGNIRQDQKWSASFKDGTIEKYSHLSKTTLTKNPDLIIWPETALPFYYGLDRDLSNRVDMLIRESKTNFLIGSPAYKREEDETLFFNRAFMLNRYSLVTGTYDKRHLVPFGEYVPMGEYLTFLGKITAQAGNFSSGDGTFQPLVFNQFKTGVLICFEILFPSISSQFVLSGADILTTITNDAWFGYTSAAKQHFAIAVFRAIENRRPVARSANTGISGFIDPKGEILKTTPLFTDKAATQDLPVLTELSTYTRYGDIFAIGATLLAMVAIFLAFVLKGARK
jgi:apolipoprotein N-acyltransferase